MTLFITLSRNLHGVTEHTQASLTQGSIWIEIEHGNSEI
jgi:hypothetical protein